MEKKLRYGENPQQEAYLYKNPADNEGDNLVDMEQLHGKKMSYNNYVDANSAFSVIKNFFPANPAKVVAIIKHTNPCGLASGKTVVEALEMAWQGDVVSSFGSIIASSHPIDKDAARFLQGKFVELILAPDYSAEALDFLRSKSSALRLLRPAVANPSNSDLKQTFTDDISSLNGSVSNKQYAFVSGGILQQDVNKALALDWKCVTKRKSTSQKKGLYEFTYRAVKSIKSNAIAIGYEYQADCYLLLGMGAGQPNRVDSVRKLALTKARENIERLYGKEKIKDVIAECVLASDAFFPFADNIKYASDEGIRFYIQPGGSIRDNEVIEACNQYGAEMIFTDTRHFLH